MTHIDSPAPENPKLKVDLHWLSYRRSEIQKLLFRLHEAAPNIPGDDRLRDSIFNLLVGAGYSLWRAVFIIDTEREKPRATEKAKTFLGLLVRDNAIAYPQEREGSEWTAGYYLSSAYHRLQNVYGRLRLTTELSTAVDKFVERQRTPGGGSSGEPLRGAWETAAKAMAESVFEFAKDVDLKPAPKPLFNEPSSDRMGE